MIQLKQVDKKDKENLCRILKIGNNRNIYLNIKCINMKYCHLSHGDCCKLNKLIINISITI
jgi:hypothetical protein